MNHPTDIRSEDPNQSPLRLRNFREGWTHAVAGRVYTQDTLSNLTWQNLGWRLGSVVGAASDPLIEEIYDWCVRQQREAGVHPSDT